MSQVYEGSEGTSFDAFLSLRSTLLEKKVRAHFSQMMKTEDRQIETETETERIQDLKFFVCDWLIDCRRECGRC